MLEMAEMGNVKTEDSCIYNGITSQSKKIACYGFECFSSTCISMENLFR